MLFLNCVCHAFASAYCCLVVTCWERADLLALVCGVKLCGFYFLIWYPGSGVVLDCIDSWSLPSFLLLNCTYAYHYMYPLFWSSDRVIDCIPIDYI